MTKDDITPSSPPNSFLVSVLNWVWWDSRSFGDGHSLFPNMKTVPNDSYNIHSELNITAQYPAQGEQVFIVAGTVCTLTIASSLREKYSFMTTAGSLNPGVSMVEPGASHSTDEEHPQRIAMPSKGDFFKVSPGDVLEWCTWGGGDWGNPLDRSAELASKEVRQKLVTIEVTLEYGVLVDLSTYKLDITTTNALLSKLASLRQFPKPILSRGGTLKELFENCEKEACHFPHPTSVVLVFNVKRLDPLPFYPIFRSSMLVGEKRTKKYLVINIPFMQITVCWGFLEGIMDTKMRFFPAPVYFGVRSTSNGSS
ncbi:hypothetical protein BU17DRAFT_61712 [Hysterangium stoloniferum]|nr:hypothetical protein BU17DRAFT_61712 [Hysterangium stoloniferum]